MKQSQLLQHMLRAAGVGAAVMAVAGMSGEALAGISATKHNLTRSSNTNYISSGAGTEICVFCHTPHGSDTTIPAPLWNKKNPNTTYSTYATMGSSTLDAKATDTGSVSLACLSCHDGTQAMDNLMNAPGSGGYNSSGARLAGAAWTGANVDTTTGKLAANIATNLGADLRNDHPIGIVYCGGYDNSNVCTDKDFAAPTRIGTADAADAKYYVEASGNSAKDKSDMILFTRNFPTDGWRGSVECASCHDPHVESKDTNTEVAFLRKSQASSGLCLACHTK